MKSETQGNLLILDDVKKSFGDLVVLNGISAGIRRGELVTFIGPSGCGKSTLLNLIAGFVPLDGGSIILDGEEISNRLPNKRKIGMVFQSYALFPHLSVEENIGYSLKIRRFKKEKIHKRVQELLNFIQLQGIGKKRIGLLSGGQQQRVALARAICFEPSILLMDEPLSNLDANLRIQMREELIRIKEELSLTMVFVTHDQEEAMSIADRVFIIKDGKIEQEGVPREIYEFPATEFVAKFVGYVNLIGLNVESISPSTNTAVLEGHIGRFIVSFKDIKIKVGDNVKMVLRPEHIDMYSQDKMEKSKEDNLIKGEVSNALYTGSMVRYIVMNKGQKLIVDVSDPQKRGIFEIGDKVSLAVPRDIHLLKEKQ